MTQQQLAAKRARARQKRARRRRSQTYHENIAIRDHIVDLRKRQLPHLKGGQHHD